MNDQEMLELAAKAAGYNVRWHDIWQCFVHNEPHNIDHPPTPAGDRHVWAPLDDDGDALRLAVKLQIQVTPGTYNKEEFTAFNPCALGVVREHRSVIRDECSSTRRAIVRAAAEVERKNQVDVYAS